MFEYVRLSTHSTSMPEVLSRECVGRFLRYPSKPAGSSRRDKASWARPPFESLSQASLGQAQLHILFAEENIIKLFSLMDALSTLWSRVISSTCSIDLCIEFMIVANNILRKHGIHVMPSWTSFKHALILSLIQSSVDDCPTLCYPLSVDTRYIYWLHFSQANKRWVEYERWSWQGRNTKCWGHISKYVHLSFWAFWYGCTSCQQFG